MARTVPVWLTLVVAVLSGSVGPVANSISAGRTASRQTASAERLAFYKDLQEQLNLTTGRLDALEATNRELATERARLLAERVADQRQIAELRREVAGLRRELSALRRRAERTGSIIGEAAACGAIERRHGP